MKFSINFNDKEIEIENDGPLKVSDLVNYLKKELLIDKDQLLKLYNINLQSYIPETTILKDDEVKNSNYLLLALDNYSKKEETVATKDIIELIDEVTNASKKMEIVEDKKKNPIQSLSLDNILNLLNTEQLLNTSPEMRDQILNLLRNQGSSESDRGSQMESSRSLTATNVQPKQELVDQLKDMGFDELRCKKALIFTNNEINAATEMLLTDQDLELPDCK